MRLRVVLRSNLLDTRVAFVRQPLPFAVVFILELGTLPWIEDRSQLGLMHEFELGKLRLIYAANFRDRGFLRLGHGPSLDTSVRVLLAQAFHRELEGGLHRTIVGHECAPAATANRSPLG